MLSKVNLSTKLQCCWSDFLSYSKAKYKNLYNNTIKKQKTSSMSETINSSEYCVVAKELFNRFKAS